MRWSVGIAVWLAIVPATAFAQKITDGELGMSLTIPAKFREFPEAKQQMPSIRRAWITGQPGTEDFAIVGYQLMGGVIGRERLTVASMPPGSFPPGVTPELRTEKWKEFDVDVIAVRAKQGDFEIVALTAQVPLKPQALQVLVTGPAAHEKELAALFRSVLATLDGPTNWLTAEERIGEGIKAAAGGIFIVTMIGLAWSRRRKRSPAT
jgi:hypothetical protein